MTKVRVIAVHVLFFLVVLLSVATAQSSSADTRQTPVSVVGPDYVIGPQDVLNINVWKEQEMSGPQTVRPDGKVSLPLIKDVPAAGLTPMALADQITDKLKQFISDPRVTVVVTEINSKKFYVLGEVGRPGAFPLLPQLTILQGLSTAGGPTQYANTKKIYLLRNENGKQVKMAFDYKSVVKGDKGEQNVLLQPGDTIVVP